LPKKFAMGCGHFTSLASPVPITPLRARKIVVRRERERERWLGHVERMGSESPVNAEQLQRLNDGSKKVNQRKDGKRCWREIIMTMQIIAAPQDHKQWKFGCNNRLTPACVEDPGI